MFCTILAQATTQPTVIDLTSWTPTIIGALSVLVAVLAYIHNFVKPAIDTAIADAKTTAVAAKTSADTNHVQTVANTASIAAVSLAQTPPVVLVPPTVVGKVLLLLLIPTLLLAGGCAANATDAYTHRLLINQAGQEEVQLATSGVIPPATHAKLTIAAHAAFAAVDAEDEAVQSGGWSGWLKSTRAASQIADIFTTILQYKGASHVATTKPSSPVGP